LRIEQIGALEGQNAFMHLLFSLLSLYSKSLRFSAWKIHIQRLWSHVKVHLG